jgi:ketosteroid isomerase-like protein
MTNLELVRGLYEAFASGNVPAVLSAMSPSIRWVEAEGGPYGGIYTGPDAVVAKVLMKLATEWSGFTVTPSEFVADGATVVAMGDYSGTYKATGKSFKAAFAHVWKLQDGKAVSFQQYVDTALHLRPMQA